MTENETEHLCGWRLSVTPKGRKTPVELECTEPNGHADGEHSGDGWSWTVIPPGVSAVEPDTEIELP